MREKLIVQVSITGPIGAGKTQVMDAIRQTMKTLPRHSFVDIQAVPPTITGLEVVIFVLEQKRKKPNVS